MRTPLGRTFTELERVYTKFYLNNSVTRDTITFLFDQMNSVQYLFVVFLLSN